ncbi:MAG: hypothetical protein MJ198_07450 [Bacteroidales bacterium]|nr:hypothetical protein [Bacteroidales bacterium]
MKKNSIKISTLFIAGLAVFASCNRNDDPKPQGEFEKASFIVCEGNFNSNDADVYAVVDKELQKEIFAETNSRPLGDVANSMKIIGNKAYIVVNNSQKVEVVNANTFESEGTIKDLSYPRYVEKRNDNEVFISNGNGYGSDFIYVVNTSSLQKVDSVATGAGPNAMVVSNGKLFVANMGGYSTDNTVTVIDVKSLAVEKTITVGDVPADMEIDEQGNILVLCKGLTNYNYDAEGNYLGAEIVSNSSLVKIDASSLTVSTIKDFDHQIACYGENVMAYNNGTIYLLDGGVMSIKGSTETTLVEDYNVYGISIDNATKGFWLMSAPYGSLHTATLYDQAGVKVNSYNVGNYPKMVTSK